MEPIIFAHLGVIFPAFMQSLQDSMCLHIAHSLPSFLHCGHILCIFLHTEQFMVIFLVPWDWAKLKLVRARSETLTAIVRRFFMVFSVVQGTSERTFTPRNAHLRKRVPDLIT